MAYTDDAVRAKLSSLNETQDAIVGVAQWIMFHKRYADRTAQLWDQRLRESQPAKRLNLVYLANEVVQQSKVRKKTEFVAAFQPIIAASTAAAYKGASVDIQQRLRRVVEVWRQRAVFDPACQQDLENRINELDKQRGGARKGGLGGSLSASIASSAPPEYQSLISNQSTITRSEVISSPAVSGANQEWDRFSDPSTAAGSPPVQAARLGALLKILANAEGAVAETLKARRSLVEGLEKLLAENKTELATEEAQLKQINSRKVEIEGKKQVVEDSIMAGFTSSTNGGGGTPDHDPPRPDHEPLTPPPIESITPVGTPGPQGFVSTTGADVVQEQPPSFNEPAPAYGALPAGAIQNGGLPGLAHHPREMSPEDRENIKRRKMSNAVDAGDEFAGFAEGGTGIDADVEAMLG